MAVAILTELRLTEFKSFRDAVLPVDDITLLTGRNSAGKSNALDGLEVLSRLVGGDDVSEALDSATREGGVIRGGSRGCAPHGRDRFSLGCTVSYDGSEYLYDITVQIEPTLRVVQESLDRLSGGVSPERVHVLYTQIDDGSHPAPRPDLNVVEVRRADHGEHLVLHKNSKSVLDTVPMILARNPHATQESITAVEAVLVALRGVIHLDPVPQLMRRYMPFKDSELRRSGENLSASLKQLRSCDGDAFAEIEDLVRSVLDDGVQAVDFVDTEIGDVIMVLKEYRGTGGEAMVETTSAQEMSDGLLRSVVVATALATAATVEYRPDVMVEEPETQEHSSISGAPLLVV